ncbi:MAG: FAD-dependent oxidoreductase [Gammaproteobacteria bacterium]|nr:FAD-dependent oxidoreductase [Gammaproteobacteria bacterium]MDE0365179.1 FAD-dependent oxidoreductase [Gammaproteobacteria bacterium]
MALEQVLSPVRIGGVDVKNRVVRTAHGTSMGYGDLSDDLIAYHIARARGGVGLSILEAASVHWSGPMTLHAWNDTIVPRYEKLMEQASLHGMRVFAQINHMGVYGGAPWQRPWSASEKPVPGSPMLAHAMSVDEIAEVTAAFAAAAARVKAGGLHGVEVHCAHDFLLQQFISVRHNRREDEYGGAFENRMRFYLEVLRAVREAVGDDFVVGTRVGPHNLPGGLNVAEHVEIVNRVLEEGIIDYLNVSHGSSLNSHKIIAAMHEEAGYEIPFSEQVTALTTLPTIVTGRFTTLAQADALIEAGKADLVGMTRAHIADPDLVRKTASGRVREVRPCIGCNQGCVGGLNKGRVGCAVNVAAGQELRLAEELIEPADKPGHIVVVGGGPAGMEAARVAALRGHRVSLFEAAPSLGGTLRAARLAPKHRSIGEIADWLSDEMERLGVEVHLGARVSAGDIDVMQPDAVIVAVGARPTVAELPPGAVPGRGVTAPELLIGGYNQVRGSALVLDEVGGYEAIGAAEFLLEQGADVTFVTSLASFTPQMMAIGVGVPAMERLQATGRFTLLTQASLASVGTDTAVVSSRAGWPDLEVDAETLVMVTDRGPDQGQIEEFTRLSCRTEVVGDAASPGFLPGAIATAHLAARSL